MTQASHNAPPQAQPIDPSDPPSMSRFLTGIANAFESTALSRAFITEIDSTSPPYPSPTISAQRILQHLTPGITDGATFGAELVHAGDYSALAVWETTSYRGVAFSETLKNVGPIREEWRTKIRQCKERYIGMRTTHGENGEETQEIKPFYHLGFLVRNPTVQTVPGAISAVMRPWLKRAEDEGVPVWLEATYEHAVEVYQHYGFRLVEIVRIGVGSRSEEGWPEEGGKGTCGYCMIYDGHLRGLS